MKHLHHAHLAPLRVDTNADQFERLGNPWISERDRLEMPVVGKGSRKIKRAGPKLGKFPKTFTEVRVAGQPRLESAAFLELQRRRRFLQSFKAALPGGTATVQGDREAPRPVQTHSHNEPPPPLTADQRAARAAQQTAELKRRADAEFRHRAARSDAKFNSFADAMSAALHD